MLFPQLTSMPTLAAIINIHFVMNLAIIISVSEYTDKSNNLPGCKTDSEIIYNVLNKTGKYNEILYIHEKLTSAQVKERFTSFIADKKTNVIEMEVIVFMFIYITGRISNY